MHRQRLGRGAGLNLGLVLELNYRPRMSFTLSVEEMAQASICEWAYGADEAQALAQTQAFDVAQNQKFNP